jgi:ribosomal protein S18 acetylase RimI-like enzyme
MGRGFNHEDPREWSSPEEYALVQTAPDYRRENDIVVEGPDGRYRSLCIIWYDDLNHFGVFEPVCTHPDFRRLGLGCAVVREGLNRLHRLGARKAYVGSGQDFYAAIGFKRLHVSRNWSKPA